MDYIWAISIIAVLGVLIHSVSANNKRTKLKEEKRQKLIQEREDLDVSLECFIIEAIDLYDINICTKCNGKEC